MSSKTFITYNIYFLKPVYHCSFLGICFYRSTGIVAGMSSLLVVLLLLDEWYSGWYGVPYFVVINSVNGFREVIKCFDCSTSTGLSSGQLSHSGLWDCSAGLSCQFGLYQKSLVCSFFSCHLARFHFYLHGCHYWRYFMVPNLILSLTTQLNICSQLLFGTRA